MNTIFMKSDLEDEENCKSKRRTNVSQIMKEDLNIEESNTSKEKRVTTGKENFMIREENGNISSDHEEMNVKKEEKNLIEEKDLIGEENDPTKEEENDSTKDEDKDSTKDEENDSIKDEENDSTKDEGNVSTKYEEKDSTRDEEKGSIKNDENDSTRDEEKDSIRDEENDSTRDEENDATRDEKNYSTKKEENISTKNEDNNSIKNEENDSIREEENNSTMVEEHIFRGVEDELSGVKIVLFVERTEVLKEERQEHDLTKKISEQEKQINYFKSMKEKEDLEKVDLVKKISELEEQMNNEKDVQKTKVSELEKLLNDEKTMKNKYEKEKDDILDFLKREVTCPVCLMIPRTKRIPICRNGHTTCETCKRMECPVCRTKMEDDMFSPLTLNITDLLAVPCIFMDQGCSIKLKKKEIVEHELEECRYRELECPGCKEKFEAFTLPEHFKICLELVFREYWMNIKLDETQIVWFSSSPIETRQPRVFKLKTSENWFLLCADVIEDKMVFYLKHYSGEGTKETFSYNLKVSDVGNKFSRSMSGVCTPLSMEIEVARRNGFTLDVSVEVMQNVCYLPNTDHNDKYKWDIDICLFKTES